MGEISILGSHLVGFVSPFSLRMWTYHGGHCRCSNSDRDQVELYILHDLVPAIRNPPPKPSVQKNGKEKESFTNRYFGQLSDIN